MEEWLYVLMKDEEERFGWYVLDFVESKWRKLFLMFEIVNIVKKFEVVEIFWGWRIFLGFLWIMWFVGFF